ncbi:MAG: NAD(P)/FAD-dependent oxidoreductase [Immundisolibacterales bacterium]|nr:NAD(P)/FAD-dependent oxidoreductase [Immundisolibacterales bacterium]
MDGTDGLAKLEADLARDFERLNHPPADWVPPRVGSDGRRMTDVLIVGGGMCGLAAAFALRRLGISNLRHVDRSPEGREGPWRTYARMEVLRSPKHLTGPVLGLPGLTFRAWWEARGNDWEGLGRIPRTVWMDYLDWYRRVTGARIENGVGVVALEPGARHEPAAGRGSGPGPGAGTGTAGVRVRLRNADGKGSLHARRVVLATGREGQAAPRVPRPLAPFVGGPVLHSSQDIDFAALRSRRVVVIGLAASAFDNAATALGAGAAEVVLVGRAPALPRLNKMKQTVYPGFTHGFPDLPDAEKLRLLDHVVRFRIAPPRDSVLRIASSPKARLMLGTEILGATGHGDALRLETTKGALVADRVILGTGFAFDLGAPRELAALSPEILRWRDRVPEAKGEWGESPYLAPDFSFSPRAGSDIVGLERLHCFTHASQLSLGNLANDIPAVSEGAERLARGIAASLYVEDREHHWERLREYAEPELFGDEWPGLDTWWPPVSR